MLPPAASTSRFASLLLNFFFGSSPMLVRFLVSVPWRAKAVAYYIAHYKGRSERGIKAFHTFICVTKQKNCLASALHKCSILILSSVSMAARPSDTNLVKYTNYGWKSGKNSRPPLLIITADEVRLF